MIFPLNYREMVELLKRHNGIIEFKLYKSSEALERPITSYKFRLHYDIILTNFHSGGNSYSEMKWNKQEWKESFIEDFLNWAMTNDPTGFTVAKL